jgi:hypothetical protein
MRVNEMYIINIAELRSQRIKIRNLGINWFGGAPFLTTYQIIFDLPHLELVGRD